MIHRNNIPGREESRKNPFRFSGPCLLFALWPLFSGCTKEDKESLGDPVPRIELLSVIPSTAVEFNDSIVFTIKYRDNDGDLGENDPDVKNLFLTDNRIGIQYSYRIQQLAPSGSSIPIEGNLELILNTIARTDTSLSQEAVTFSIYVVDRAGNKSNVVTSSPVIIIP